MLTTGVAVCENDPWQCTGYTKHCHAEEPIGKNTTSTSSLLKKSHICINHAEHTYLFVTRQDAWRSRCMVPTREENFANRRPAGLHTCAPLVLSLSYIFSLLFSSTEVPDLAVYTARFCGHGSAVRNTNGEITCVCPTGYTGLGCEQGEGFCVAQSGSLLDISWRASKR